MIVDISFERIEGADFILGAVYGPRIFKIVSVFSIFGLVWQTQVVTSSSCVGVMTAGSTLGSTLEEEMRINKRS